MYNVVQYILYLCTSSDDGIIICCSFISILYGLTCTGAVFSSRIRSTMKTLIRHDDDHHHHHFQQQNIRITFVCTTIIINGFGFGFVATTVASSSDVAAKVGSAGGVPKRCLCHWTFSNVCELVTAEVSTDIQSPEI